VPPTSLNRLNQSGSIITRRFCRRNPRSLVGKRLPTVLSTIQGSFCAQGAADSASAAGPLSIYAQTIPKSGNQGLSFGKPPRMIEIDDYGHAEKHDIFSFTLTAGLDAKIDWDHFAADCSKNGCSSHSLSPEAWPAHAEAQHQEAVS
jgi:hypothetical protein